MSRRKQKRVHRIYLRFPYGLSYSVFVRAYDRAEAEEKALKQHSDALGVNRSEIPFG